MQSVKGAQVSGFQGYRIVMVLEDFVKAASYDQCSLAKAKFKS